MKEKLKSNNLLPPFMAIVLLILFFSILSLIFSKINLEGSVTSIVNGKLETSMVVSQNVFTKEGIIYFLSNITTNFSTLEPLALIIVSLFSVSILDASGIFKHIFSKFKRLKSSVITFMIVLIGVLSSIIGNYSYIFLIPLVAVMYKYINKNPIVGVMTMFTGITLGYGVSIFCNFDTYAIGMLTQNSASLEVDPTYKFSAFSSFYISVVTTFLITFLITLLLERYLTKKLPLIESYEDNKKTSKKALIISFITFILLVILLAFWVNKCEILDTTQDFYIAKLFSANSPFNLSFVYIVLFVSAIISYIYGRISKNFSDNRDYSLGYTVEFNNIGMLFILLFLSSILISVINYSNIGVILVSKLLYLIELLDFAGIPLIVISFILFIIMGLIMPGSLEKWILISPTLIPLFMRANITPDFTQFIFQIADGIGKMLTPLFVYFILALGIIKKYNKDYKLDLFSTVKLTFPVILLMILVYIVLIVVWYISGLPLGIGTYATM